jgi:hypothetical protein
MKTIADLQILHTQSAQAVAKMRGIAERRRGEEERFRADTSRSENYITENVRASRDTAVADIGAHYPTVVPNAKAAAAARRHWESKELVLSQKRYSSDLTVAIRSARLAEFANLPSALLAQIADNAREQGDAVTAWIAYASNLGHAGGPGFVPIDLAAVELPEQTEALRLIDETIALQANAELVVGETSGRLDPTKKMQLGRRMAPLEEAA